MQYIKIFLLSALLLLNGCATYVNFSSYPSGAVLEGPANWRNPDVGGRLSLTTPQRISYPYALLDNRSSECPEIMTPSARWADGVIVQPLKLKLCHKDNYYIFKKPGYEEKAAERMAAERALTDKQPIEKKIPLSDSGFNIAKQKCRELGFKSGTEDFGKCVLQLTK